MRLYLASTERSSSDRRKKLVSTYKPPYLLVSYQSLTNDKIKNMVLDWYRSDWCKDLMLDSGAFSFSATQYGGANTNVDWDKYLDGYIEFINASGVENFFELDIDDIVGLKKVEEMRRKIERRTGKRPIPVWHKDRKWEYFERMCKEYDYVSIGGVAKNPNGPKIAKVYPYFIDYAHNKGCKIHGLGFTDLKKLRTLNFDSVDSTNWNTGGRFGVLYKMQDSYLIAQNDRSIKKRRNGDKLDEHNIEIWSNYARFIDT